MKIVFFGSDDFALAYLTSLYASGHRIIGCVTQPDRRKGRGMKRGLSPVKEFAYSNNILCFQPEDISDPSFEEGLKALHADLFVVISYGQILPQAVLDVPSSGAVNVHGSLLPSYRGAAPINWAIINGETKTGLTVIAMNQKMDAGDILGQLEIGIGPEDTSLTVRRKMMAAGPNLLERVIGQIQEKTAVYTRQDENRVSVAPKLNKGMGEVNWEGNALNIHNFIRGLLPWPCGHTFYGNKQLKLLSSRLVDGENETAGPGEIVNIGSEGMTVKTGQGLILIQEVQPESSKRMTALEFANGQRVEKGFVFAK